MVSSVFKVTPPAPLMPPLFAAASADFEADTLRGAELDARSTGIRCVGERRF